MKSTEVTELAIKRHDIDAEDFQSVYTKADEKAQTVWEAVFLEGRQLVLAELNAVLATLPKGSKILDVGCGTAHLTHWVKEKGFIVCGIEPSAEMLKYAQVNFPDIEIKQAISSSIPYANASFDLVVAFEVLRYLDAAENKKTFEEFYRVLKPDGRFFITQVNLFSADFYFLFYHLKRWYHQLRKKPYHHCHFTTAARQEKAIKQAGFTAVKTIGRLFGSIRIFYKLGKQAGKFYASLVKYLFPLQRTASFYKNLMGHLIVIAKKGS